MKEYVTLPSVSVETAKLLEEAKNLSKFDTEVVDISPFTSVVIMPLFADKLLEFIRVVVEVLPFTTDVNSLTADVKSF